MLAEISTKEISETRNPDSFNEHMEIAKEGGDIAKHARLELEKSTGKAVVTPTNAKQGMLSKNDPKKLLEI